MGSRKAGHPTQPRSGTFQFAPPPRGLWHIINLVTSGIPAILGHSSPVGFRAALRAADSCRSVARCPDARLLLQEDSAPHIVSYCLALPVFPYLVSLGGNAALAPVSPRPLPLLLRLQ